MTRITGSVPDGRTSNLPPWPSFFSALAIAVMTDALSIGLGLGIADLGLLDRALTHASIYSDRQEPARDYEALEFLGDAVLGLAISHCLLEWAPDRTPGEYSRVRAGVVNRRCLARVAADAAANVYGAPQCF